MMTRRQAIKTTALASAAFAVLPGAIAQTNTAAPAAAPTGPFTLPPLPYAYDALEPHIDAQTMQIHHDKHHAAYITNLNKAVATGLPATVTPAVETLLKDLSAVPESIRTAVRNNGGGHYNHSLFWQMMKKNDGGGGNTIIVNKTDPLNDTKINNTLALNKAIETTFGSFPTFQDNFTKAALGQFGSGWAWLVWDGSALKIEPTPNQDSPLSSGKTPLLGLDVWEHAYYLKYQNRRVDYIAAWWNVVNWDFVAERYAKSAS